MDKEQLDKWFDLHFEELRTFAISLVRDVDLGDEGLDHAYVGMAKVATDLTEHELRPYLTRAIQNYAKDKYRRDSRLSSTNYKDSNLPHPEPSEGKEGLLDSQRSLGATRGRIDADTAKGGDWATVIRRVMLEGKTCAEAAREVGWKPSRARQAVSRYRKKLRSDGYLLDEEANS